MTIAEICQENRVTRALVNKWVRLGFLHPRRVHPLHRKGAKVVVDRSEVESLIESLRKPAS